MLNECFIFKKYFISVLTPALRTLLVATRMPSIAASYTSSPKLNGQSGEGLGRARSSRPLLDTLPTPSVQSCLSQESAVPVMKSGSKCLPAGSNLLSSSSIEELGSSSLLQMYFISLIFPLFICQDIAYSFYYTSAQ